MATLLDSFSHRLHAHVMIVAALGFFAYLFFGAALKRSKRLPVSTPAVLNAFILNLALPAMVLLKVHGIRSPQEILIAACMPWILLLLSWILFSKIGKKFQWSRSTTGAVILLSGLCNTSFLGFPMLESLMGSWALETAVLVDQLGTFLAFSTLGILIASYYSGTERSQDTKTLMLESLKRILLFIPFWALIAAILLRPLPYPPALTTWLQRLSDSLLPLALVSVGFQWKLRSSERLPKRAVFFSLAYKLALFPLFFYAMGHFAFPNLDAKTFSVIVVESGMSPMINAGVLAEEFRLNPELAQKILTLGILLSFVTVPLIVSLLQL